MGKSFKSEKNYYSENRTKQNYFKQRKNQIKEDHLHEELSDYKIHGYKKKSPN